MLHPDGQFGVDDIAEAARLEQLGKLALAGPRELRFVGRLGIELPNRRPEQAQWAPPTGVVPDARDDDSTRTGDSRHLAQAGDRIRHEMDDQLRESDVELGIGKGQLLGRRTPDVDAGMALAGGGHE